MTADLVAFLRARLDEDEQAARAAGGERWVSSSNVYARDTNDPIAIGPWSIDLDEVGEHIARWDPARVLAEVAAKRAILDQLVMYALLADGGDDMIRLLARPYAEHPHFHPSWSTA